MNTFKHSGTTGDLIYSLPIVKHFGGGEFYLHLNQIDFLSQHFYGVNAPAFHAGRMNNVDYNFIKPLIEAQPYITKFAPLDSNAMITHNLDKFRPLFIKHPGNYVDVYATAFDVNDDATKEQLRKTPWLTVPSVLTVDSRDVVINRTLRWIPSTLSTLWNTWREKGVEQRAVFVGLPEEYDAFKKMVGWNIPYQPTKNLLEVAQYIAGSQGFIGNQSVALSIAIGLGHQGIWCEGRRDLPIERNECYFPLQQGLNYF
jgi:hypothetical protein